MTVDLEKGLVLEHVVAGYLQAHGYFVRRGVQLSVAAGTADATDIDVIGLRFIEPLREDRIIADCKGKKKPRPFERVLWTTGLRDVARAQHALAVMPHAPWQAREFASQAGVEIVDSSLVAQWLEESQYGVFGEANVQSTQTFYDRYSVAKDALKDADREDLRLRQMLVIGNALTNVNRIIVLVSGAHARAQLAFAEERWVWEVLLRNAIVIGIAMMARFCAESKYLPEADRRALVRKKLTFGDMPANKAVAIAKSALGPAAQSAFPEPEYTDEFVEAVELMVRDQAATALVPFVADLVLIGRNVFGSRCESPDRFHPDVVARADRLGKKLASALSYASELRSDLWSTSVPTPASLSVARPTARRGSGKVRRPVKGTPDQRTETLLDIRSADGPQSNPAPQ